jgi:site-specific recombinase XerC
MEAEIERRGVGDSARHTVEQYLFRWLATLRDRGEHSPATLECYTRCITAAKPWVGDIPLSNLSTADLDHAYGELRKRGGRTRDGEQTRPLSARTVLNIHRSLHTALEQARKWKLIAENPVRDARAPSPLRSWARAFTADEVRRLLDVAAADPRPIAWSRPC